MEFTKKTKLMTATLISSIAGGLVVAGFAMNKNGAFKAKAEDVTYTLKLDGTNGRIAVPQGEDYADSFTALATSPIDKHTETVEFGGSMLLESEEENNFGKMIFDWEAYEGTCLYNITPINSIKRVSITYIACDRNLEEDGDYETCLNCYWSWDKIYDLSLNEDEQRFGGFEKMAFEEYEDGFSEPTSFTKTFEFFDETPNYFCIYNVWDTIDVSSIEIEYSCAVKGETPEYYSGFNLFTTYVLDDETDSYILNKYDGDSFSEIDIPSTYRGKPVTSIGQCAFQGHGEIVSITFPDTITVIGHSAFLECTSLTSVDLSNTSISTVEDNLFKSSGVQNVKLPDTVTKIKTSAFDSTPLIEIIVPENVLEIGNLAFANCPYLEAVYYRGDNKINLKGTIPDGIYNNSGIDNSIHFYFERETKEGYSINDYTNGCSKPVCSYDVSPEDFEIARGRGTK